jgi:hypothetical protein
MSGRGNGLTKAKGVFGDIAAKRYLMKGWPSCNATLVAQLLGWSLSLTISVFAILWLLGQNNLTFNQWIALFSSAMGLDLLTLTVYASMLLWYAPTVHRKGFYFSFLKELLPYALQSTVVFTMAIVIRNQYSDEAIKDWNHCNGLARNDCDGDSHVDAVLLSLRFWNVALLQVATLFVRTSHVLGAAERHHNQEFPDYIDQDGKALLRPDDDLSKTSL